MLCLSNGPARFFLLSGLALTIGTTCPIAQAQTDSGNVVEVKSCNVKLLDERQLACAVPGVLSFVTPEEGDEVIAEQVIAGLQDDVMKAQKAVAMKEAENDVEKRYSEKAAELADAEFQKALEANRRLKGVVAFVEIERLRLAAERAHLQIEQAEHQLEVANLRAVEAEANLMVYQIKAPITGVVTRKFKSRGEAVRQGDTILEIISTTRVKVEGYVSLEDSISLKPGDAVVAYLDIANVDLEVEKKPFQGVLKYVGRRAEPISGNIRVWAEVQNPDNILKAGLTARMKITPNPGQIQTTQVYR